MVNEWVTYLKRAKTEMNEPGANQTVHELQAPDPTENFTEKD
jgi:hypothetical protein